MAVPKKRTSKSKKNSRKANWKKKGYKSAQKSLSLAKSMLKGKSTSFVYSIYISILCFIKHSKKLYSIVRRVKKYSLYEQNFCLTLV
mgnify:CR=1 FL=1